jgi:hypothetical protein
MKELIKNYKISCDMAKERIGELRLQRNTLRQKNAVQEIEKLDLDRRIRLLCTEYIDMREIIDNLEKYDRVVHN